MKGCGKEFINNLGEIALCHKEDGEYNESYCDDCFQNLNKENKE